MFPNLYSYVKVFPFESVKTRCFFQALYVAQAEEAEGTPLPSSPPAAAVQQGGMYS